MSESELREEVEDLKERVSRLEERLESGSASSENVTGLREFVGEFDPSTHTERALAIGYHLDEHQGQEKFTSDDIEDGYRTARESPPANMSDVLANCEERDWMMRDGEEGQTQLRMLTSGGLDYVEEVLEDGA